MEILKKGSEKTWTKKVKCTGKGNGGAGCGALLRINKDDLYRNPSCCRDGSIEEFFTSFSCPCCKSETDIKVPEKLRPSINREEYFLKQAPLPRLKAGSRKRGMDK